MLYIRSLAVFVGAYCDQIAMFKGTDGRAAKSKRALCCLSTTHQFSEVIHSLNVYSTVQVTARHTQRLLYAVVTYDSTETARNSTSHSAAQATHHSRRVGSQGATRRPGDTQCQSPEAGERACCAARKGTSRRKAHAKAVCVPKCHLAPDLPFALAIAHRFQV
jgi:hypothetical protein